MRISLLIFLVSIQMACGVAEERYHIDEETTPDSNTDDQGGVAFHSSTGWTGSVTFFVEANAPDQIVEASENAAQTWNDAVGYNVLSFGGIAESDRGEELYTSLDDTMTVVYYEESWLDTTGKPSTTLATTVWENAAGSDEIVKGDIILNAEIYAYQDSTVVPDEDDEVESTSYVVDTETVLLHEFGHLLGLDHVTVDEDENSVMHPKTFIGLYMHSRELSEGDAFNIQELYPQP
ncbi:matrixin family metalloprotease [Pseudobacteriovorax antillogorgiicola]|uniref:Matrixin n=1 Tax=Pseudobacteriovorax antillogorgiicola TaxID=1513793 RepID=A0A1Y6B4V4_9BACT|nr:matrixin family metalloprotease [Pseudobacteriovorax antillogorgiicola]TCS59498.1 matrixin [Pseudobacteriovorax antillogorgiicola]SME87905.1 Matrixin [Pseudobacteriovorax antillogorgiicola]